MSGWVTFVFVMLALVGKPAIRAKRSNFTVVAVYSIWAIVLLLMLGALLVDAKGWP